MSFYFYFFFCLLAYRTHQAVQPLGSTSIRTWALISPSWTSTSQPTDFMTPGDHISLLTSSSAGTSTSYDDFAIQLDMKAGSGFLPPIQQ
jgi:hypothetical protein